MTESSPRLISRSLAGYLCGTHSGALRSRRGDRLPAEELAEAHRSFEPSTEGVEARLGGESWRPDRGAVRLARQLESLLDDRHLIDLVVFGSQARGTTTGFSDLDAILVVTDAAAEQPNVLRRLRRRVLAAQRAVIAHQPMQHHAFEVATPRLLEQAGESLALPPVALSDTRSLRGEVVQARFGERDGLAERAQLDAVADAALGAGTWPRHPWRLHRLVSMFELIPTLYLQARGQAVPKWRSFQQARPEFGADWWPYDVLAEVRSAWPAISAGALRTVSPVVRNPWLAVESWTRLPVGTAEPVRRLLRPECLGALHGIVRRMRDCIR